MLKRACLLGGVLVSALLSIRAQDIKLSITEEIQRPTLAIPNLRGAGESQSQMSLVNTILWDDLAGSGMMKLAPRMSYPPAIPQQPQDLLTTESAAGETPPGQTVLGRRISDWSRPPVSADYLGFGYAAAQNGVLVLYGWMYDARRGLPAGVQVIGSRYVGALSEEGARKVAHEFAADIIRAFGGQPISGTHIYFTSDRTGHKEIWTMDADGRDQRQITRFNFIAGFPSISPDGSKIAFTGWRGAGVDRRVFVYSVDPVRDLGFRNQNSSASETPSFTPDGSHIVYSAKVDRTQRIFLANLDGSDPRPVTTSELDDAEPEVNPRTGRQIVFSSGRSGPQQVYVCNIDGSDVQRLTDGTGEASNPSWSPDGQFIAFAWTRNHGAGRYNIFIMELATQKLLPLTDDDNCNENPSWDPGGAHIVFSSKRSGAYQIWTMLANGTGLQQLTTAGNNTTPVWGR